MEEFGEIAMKTSTFLVSAAILGGASLIIAAPASARVEWSVNLGGGGYYLPPMYARPMPYYAAPVPVPAPVYVQPPYPQPVYVQPSYAQPVYVQPYVYGGYYPAPRYIAPPVYYHRGFRHEHRYEHRYDGHHRH